MTRLGGLKIRDVLNGADIVAGGASSQFTTIAARDVGAGTTIDIDSSFKKLTANSVGTATITTPAIGTLSIKSNFNADVDLAGTGIVSRPVSLKSSKIGGGISGSVWSIIGDVGSIAARGTVQNWDLEIIGKLNTGRFAQVNQSTLAVSNSVNSIAVQTFLASDLFAGFVPTGPAANWEPSVGGTFNSQTAINSFTVKGVRGSPTPAFANSNVVASQIGKVRLASVQVSNGGVEFGIVADTAVRSAKVLSPAFVYSVSTGETQKISPSDDFGIWII